MLIKYEKPEIELMMFQMEAIITGSLGSLEEVSPTTPEGSEEWGNIYP